MNDPRYILLLIQGDRIGYNTLGRDIDVDAEAIHATKLCAATGLNGWIVRASHSFNARCKPTLTMIREVCAPSVAFADAVVLAGGK